MVVERPPVSVASVDPEITAFLREHHVLSLATTHRDAPYVCNCYYVFLTEDVDPRGEPCFIFMSSRDTRHAREMLLNARVAGTVHLEPPPDESGLEEIRGVQFTGWVRPLSEPRAEPETYAERYYAAFPFARRSPGEFWHLQPDYLKMTDNRIHFGFKRYWPEAR